MIQHAQDQKARDGLQQRREFLKRLASVKKREEKSKARHEASAPPSKKQKTDRDPQKQVEDDDKFILDEYESDDEGQSKRKSQASASATLSAETQQLMTKLGMGISTSEKEEDSDMADELKIFFCSRTHSQLSQFTEELRKAKFPPAIPPDPGGQLEDNDELSTMNEDVRHLTLGSRKNLCINPKVSKLGNAAAITERCLELQQPNTSLSSKCQYLPTRTDETHVNSFRDHALARVRDIEDLGVLGKKIGICPYYASRAAVKPSEIITLPYPLLLLRSAREALDLSLKNHIVIIDEAHNLIDAIMNMHAVSISLQQLDSAREKMGVYLQKFRNRLKGKNRVYITQLVRLIDSLSHALHSRLQNAKLNDAQVYVGDMLSGKGVDQINLHKLARYLQDSKLAQKVESYGVHVTETMQASSETLRGLQTQHRAGTATPVLLQVQTFIIALANPATEGRFFFSRETSQDNGRNNALLKYLLLDPTECFKEIVDEARAVILAGGTMSPMNDYTNHLFHYLPLDRLSLLSCGHVIPPSNLLACPIAKGPSGIEFEFSFERRQSEVMLRELGMSILEFSKRVPHGLVVFFSSYSYLDLAMKTWQANDENRKDGKSVWTELSEQKRVFMEPKSSSDRSQMNRDSASTSTDQKRSTSSTSRVDAVLTQYSEHIGRGGGALLFAVIGGSLSEGINFSDRLGRGIVVVGLPYPNAQSSEWKARLEYVQQRSRPAGMSDSTNSNASKEYYENVCMRAVNQSVGRAIRHKNDYAVILLVDKRYERENIKAKLPGWIRNSLRSNTVFRNSASSIGEFFHRKEA